jgi:zona occludens toxin (predicted ATPase)
MTDRKRNQTTEPARPPETDETAPEGDEEITPAEAEGPDDATFRERRKAAAALLSPAIAPAGAGAMIDADPRLDDRSETEAALERAKGTPD